MEVFSSRKWIVISNCNNNVIFSPRNSNLDFSPPASSSSLFSSPRPKVMAINLSIISFTVPLFPRGTKPRADEEEVKRFYLSPDVGRRKGKRKLFSTHYLRLGGRENCSTFEPINVWFGSENRYGIERPWAQSICSRKCELNRWTGVLLIFRSECKLKIENCQRKKWKKGRSEAGEQSSQCNLAAFASSFCLRAVRWKTILRHFSSFWKQDWNQIIITFFVYISLQLFKFVSLFIRVTFHSIPCNLHFSSLRH